MEIISVTEELYQQLLKNRTEILNSQAPIIDKHRQIKSNAQDILDRVRQLISTATLDDEQEEIDIFKRLLPSFYSLLLYHSHLYEIEMTKPLSSTDAVKRFYQAEIGKIESFQLEHADFYRYWRAKHSHLDHLYFTRKGSKQLPHSSAIMTFIDTGCCTEYTYKAAILKTHERLSEYLAGSLRFVDAPKQSRNTLPTLSWTDSKTGLTELIYALQEKGSFNNGRATLKEITTYFEQVFNVELGNYTRTFQVILSRKIEYANYIKQLEKHFLARVDRNESKHIK